MSKLNSHFDPFMLNVLTCLKRLKTLDFINWESFFIEISMITLTDTSMIRV